MFEEDFEKIAGICKPSDTQIIGPVLYFLTKLIKAEVTLELGLGDGYVSLLLCHVSQKHYAIERRADRCEKFKKISEGMGIKNATIINNLSKDIDWNTEIDLIFQDASHRLPGIKEDIDKFAPFVKKDGLFCLHDYCWPRNDVKKVVDKEFGANWEVVTIPFELGLTICRRL